jgi:MFS family permease
MDTHRTSVQQHGDAINGVHNEKDEMHGTSERVAEATEETKEQDSAEHEDEAETEYPSGWKLAFISAALCLSVFCMALDNTIIATAIPRITDHFHALDDVGWYASAYLLTTCSFQLIFGKLYTFYSIKWTYLSALFIFELGSLICGVAPSSIALIIGRAVAGLGSAGIFSGAILIVAHTVPLRQRPTYTGMIGGMYGIASVAGPLMGGAFTDNPKLTWRWCFYINLPFGLITTLFIVFFFTSPKRTKAAKLTAFQQLSQMDLLGSFFFLPGVVCLLLALQWGGTKYPWGNGRIIALLVIAPCLLAAFVAVQIWRQEKATVPPRIFKNRNIWACAFFGACLGGAFFVMIFYVSISRITSRRGFSLTIFQLPIWFQAIKGVSAVKSGIMNLPLILGLVIISMASGAAVSIFGYYTPFMYISIVLMAIGAGLMSTFTINSGHAMWIGYQFLFGAGIGFGMQQTLIAAQTCMPLADVPIATAIMMFSQVRLGPVFFSSLQLISLVDPRWSSHRVRWPKHLHQPTGQESHQIRPRHQAQYHPLGRCHPAEDSSPCQILPGCPHRVQQISHANLLRFRCSLVSSRHRRCLDRMDFGQGKENRHSGCCMNGSFWDSWTHCHPL